MRQLTASLLKQSTPPVTEHAGVGGAIGDNEQPHALWVFSHNACGVYGYNARITHAGRSNPEGRIVLESEEHDFLVGSGSALLLRINGDAQFAENQSASK